MHNSNFQAHLFPKILLIGRNLMLSLFFFFTWQVVLGADTVFQKTKTNWSHLKFFFIHDQPNLKCYQSAWWLPHWKRCKPKAWCFYFGLCWISSLMLFAFWCVFNNTQTQMHRLGEGSSPAATVYWFVYLHLPFQDKNREHSLCPCCGQSHSSRDSRHVPDDGEKDLQEQENDSPWTPGGQIISTARVQME